MMQILNSHIQQGHFLRFEFFTPVLETEIGGGFGQLRGVDSENQEWNTNMIPIDLRFILSPFDMDVWGPFVYAGVGGLYFDNDKIPQVFHLTEYRKKKKVGRLLSGRWWF